jgi:murein DD-endopeptidase MepM/ murein hydrolase activator NlpD
MRPGSTHGLAPAQIVDICHGTFNTSKGPLEFCSLYAHFDSIDAAIMTRATVARGQTLGTTCASGCGDRTYWITRGSAAHLHFSIHANALGTGFQVDSSKPITDCTTGGTGSFNGYAVVPEPKAPGLTPTSACSHAGCCGCSSRCSHANCPSCIARIFITCASFWSRVRRTTASVSPGPAVVASPVLCHARSCIGNLRLGFAPLATSHLHRLLGHLRLGAVPHCALRACWLLLNGVT